MNVRVDQWVGPLNIANLNVTARVVTDGSSIYCSTSPRLNTCSAADRKKGASSLMFDDFEQFLKLGVPAGKNGKVNFSLTIQYQGTEKVPHGRLEQSTVAYDKKVAGVVPGAGNHKTGIVLDKNPLAGSRRPIALIGKVNCKVDARYSPVEVGDLLTTSPTPGYAMKASDPQKAFGSVIGKALGGLNTGQGTISILIELQ
jgi:hypothetical protein